MVDIGIVEHDRPPTAQFNPTRRGIEFFGVNNMVFASDAPVGPIRKCIDMIDRVGLDAKAIRKIFVANGERLPGMSLA